MESSIAIFLWRQPACERLPTSFAAASLPTLWVGHLRPLVCCAFLPPRLAVSWLPLAPSWLQLSGSCLRRLLRFRPRFPATRLRKQQATSNKRQSNATQAMAGKGRAASESPNRANSKKMSVSTWEKFSAPRGRSSVPGISGKGGWC